MSEPREAVKRSVLAEIDKLRGQVKFASYRIGDLEEEIQQEKDKRAETFKDLEELEAYAHTEGWL